MQAYVDAQVDPVILWVPPTGVHDLVGVRGRIDGTIRDTIIHAVVPIVKHPIAEAVRPVAAAACITHTGLRRWRSRRRWNGAILIRDVARECEHAVVERVVGCGVIEDRFL
jgi:hypothetical protein